MNPPFSVPVRVHQIGARLESHLEPDADQRAEIAKALDLAALGRLAVDGVIEPCPAGWRLTGRIQADAVQTCGLTLEPLPVKIDDTFSLVFSETVKEIEELDVLIDLDDETPDLVEDGQVDLGVYAVEQLALRLDPFPRKEGAVFEQPEEPGEISPFAVLRQLKGDA